MSCTIASFTPEQNLQILPVLELFTSSITFLPAIRPCCLPRAVRGTCQSAVVTYALIWQIVSRQAKHKAKHDMNSPFVDIPLALSMPYQNYAIEPLQSSGGVIGRNTRGETPSNQRIQCSSSNAFELEQLRRPHPFSYGRGGWNEAAPHRTHPFYRGDTNARLDVDPDS